MSEEPYVKKKTGPKGPRSVVWYYFDRAEPTRAKCKICGSLVRHANNTSNLFKHLRAKHPASFKDAESQKESAQEFYHEQKIKAGKPVTRGVRGRPPKNPALQAAKTHIQIKTEDSPATVSVLRKSFGAEKPKQSVTKSLLRMIALDLHQPSIVDGSGFREFIRTLDPYYDLPTKKQLVKNLLPDLAQETKVKIKTDVSIASHFALSVEAWDYQKVHSYMTISAHFIKNSWEICNIVLESFDCTEEKTDTNIATNFKRITDEWGITERVIALVARASDDVSNSSLINGWEELTCFGHTMNQVIKNALTSVAELVRIQKKTSDAVCYFESNSRAAETLAAVQQQHNMPVHKLKQENSRFWTSTYAMFERMVEQYEAVNTVLCFLGKENMCLCDDEVELIRSVIEVLMPFEAATKELCTEQYTYMSKVIPIATLLQRVTSTGISTHPGPQSALKNALISQMQQHFANVENNYFLAVATLLDPRFKHHAFTDTTAVEEAQTRLRADLEAVVQSQEMDSSSKTSNTADNASSSLWNMFDRKVSATKVDKTTTSFWNMFDRKVSEAGAMKNSSSEAENETRRYFKEANIPRNANPLQWWKLNEIQFPNLKSLAQKFLCIPATASPSSRLFTKDGDAVVEKRDMIKNGNLQSVVFLNKNLE